VTIVVGFISKGGIAFGSDSQMTKDSTKVLNSQKIFTIKFPCPGMTSEVLLAQSGFADIGAIVIDKLQTIAHKTKFDSWDVPIKAMKQVLREVRRELWENITMPNDTEEDRQKFFIRNNTSFLLGYYFTGDKPTTFVPHLYSFDLAMGHEIKAKNGVGILGSGGELAEFVMRSIDFSEFGFAQASVAAIYIIEQVKESNLYCSGRTQMSGIMAPAYKVRLPLVTELPRKRIEDTIELLSEREANLRTAFKREIDEVISEVVKKQKKSQ